jgi:hypothetical protein
VACIRRAKHDGLSSTVHVHSEQRAYDERRRRKGDAMLMSRAQEKNRCMDVRRSTKRTLHGIFSIDRSIPLSTVLSIETRIYIYLCMT